MVIAPGSAAPVAFRNRYPGVRAGGIRHVAVSDTQDERLAGGEVVGCTVLDAREAGGRGVLVDVSVVQFVDEVHVAVSVELNALVRSTRDHVLVHEVRPVIAVRSDRVEDRGRIDCILEFEQTSVGARASGGVCAPAFLACDQRSPRRPEGRIERDVTFQGRTVPDGVGFTRDQVVTLHARLVRFEDSEKVPAFLGARLIQGDQSM